MDEQNRGEKSYAIHHEKKFSMGFITAVSRENTYGIMGSTWNKDPSIICRFISEEYRAKWKILKKTIKRAIIVMNNPAYHKSKEVDEILKKTNIIILTITHYCPWLNPVEKYILCIKYKLKRQVWNGK